MDFAPEARDRWEEFYLADWHDTPGHVIGALAGRGSAQTARLALTYALADGRDAIGLEHLEAAIAVWDYSRATVEYLFGSDAPVTGMPKTVLDAARAAGGTLSWIDAHELLGKRKGAVEAAAGELHRRGLVTIERRTGPGPGRPKRCIVLVEAQA
jgi:hypothetical protein